VKLARPALSIRTQLLLVLSVFLIIPWLGYEYVREIERLLRDAQEQTLAGTAQAVATALHERARLFAEPPLASGEDDAATGGRGTTGASPSTEIAQILRGLTRTTSRIWVIDRDLNVLARAGTLRRAPATAEADAAGLARPWRWFERTLLHPFYRRLLQQPTEDFDEEAAGRTLGDAREVTGALAGILTIERRPTPDRRAVIVTAAHPIWVGDNVRGAVLVEETTNSITAERNRAFERLFNIVLAALLVGSTALTLFASRLTARIRRLRDEAERAIDRDGRVIGTLAVSEAGDEIGDLSRSFASVLARLGQYASYQQNMASRLSHELRTPIAVVRSSLENLHLQPLPPEAQVYIERAQGGIGRLNAILTRMTEATRLEHSLADAERTEVDLRRLVAACIDGYRVAYPECRFEGPGPGEAVPVDGNPDLIAQMLDKLVANAVEFGMPETPIRVQLHHDGGDIALAVGNEGPPLPQGMERRLFDSMVSVRAGGGGETPHLGLGLYIVRLIAAFHGGSARAENRDDGRGVVVTVNLPAIPAASP
jgi:dedicated sortase system histidine kinase